MFAGRSIGETWAQLDCFHRIDRTLAKHRPTRSYLTRACSCSLCSLPGPKLLLKWNKHAEARLKPYPSL